MFSIASQTVTLRHPKAEQTSLLVFTGIQGHDTSRCILELGEPDGNKIRLVFNRAGMLISQDWIERPDGDDDANPVLTGAHIVDGRDTRADNPYTHVAPATHGDPVIDAGGLQPDVIDADGKPAVTPEMREQALHEAAERAKNPPDDFDEAEEHDDYPMAGAPPDDLPQGEPAHLTAPTSPGPNPFEAPPLRNRMTPPDRVNTTESLRNG